MITNASDGVTAAFHLFSNLFTSITDLKRVTKLSAATPGKPISSESFIHSRMYARCTKKGRLFGLRELVQLPNRLYNRRLLRTLGLAARCVLKLAPPL